MTASADGQHSATPADFVTGLQPRSVLEALLKASGTAGGGHVVLFGVDLIGLKQVNKTEGFLAGDRLLAAGAATLIAATPGATLRARLGGDELVAVFTGPTAIAAAEAAGNALRTCHYPSMRWGFVLRKPEEPPPQLVERLYAAIRLG